MKDLWVKCPFHSDGQERTPSLSILLQDRDNLKAGFAHCFGCGWTGHFTQVEKALGYELDIPPYIRSKTQGEAPSYIPTRLRIKSHTSQGTCPKKSDTPYKFSPYLKSRGIGEQVQELNRIYEKGGKVFMPFFNPYGDLMGHIERSTDEKWFQVQGSLKYPIGIEEISPADFLYVTEGQIDKMSAEEMGFHAIALGTVSNYRLLQKIKNLNLVLALDNDEAGNSAVELIKKILPERSLYRVYFKDGVKDMNDLLLQEGNYAKSTVLSSTRRI